MNIYSLVIHIKLSVTIGLLTILILFSLDTKGQTVIPDSLLYQTWEVKGKVTPWTEGCDSIIYPPSGRILYFNVDSVCHLIATRDFSEIIEDLQYFHHISSIYGKVCKKTYSKMLKANERYKSKALEREIDICEAHVRISPPATPEGWEFGKKLYKKYENKGDLQTKLRIMERMLYAGNGAIANPAKDSIQIERVPVIELINEILSTLEQLNGEPYEFNPGFFYQGIGLIYYSCKYYDKAIPLFQKATEKLEERYINNHTMLAWDYQGNYYAINGDYDRSDSLYLCMLRCPYNVKHRAIYDAVAIGAIAGNFNSRGNKDEAMRLYNIAFSRALQEKDFTLAGGYAIYLGRLYMEKGELEKTKKMIGLARDYLVAGGLPIRYWEIYYTLTRDYYLEKNNASIVKEYIDSISYIKTEEETVFNTRVLAYAEQETYEKEKAMKEEQFKKQRMSLILIVTVLILTLLLLGILFFYFKKLQEKNRALYYRIKAQDNETAKQERLWQQFDSISGSFISEDKGENNSSTEDELSYDVRKYELFIRLREYLLTDMNYTKAEIDTNVLISKLSTNRSYLFDAIRSCTGKTLQEYVNYLRLEKAKRLLEKSDKIIEDIAIECGYNSVRTFYRLFKLNYNISPAVYRKLSQENT